MRGAKGDTCRECRAIGRQKHGFEACYRTGTSVCRREANLAEATEAVGDDPVALLALRLWDASQSQWRVGFGGATGLDYPAVWLVAGAIGVEVSSDVFRLLQALEADQLSEWNEAAEKARAASSGHGGRVTHG